MAINISIVHFILKHFLEYMGSKIRSPFPSLFFLTMLALLSSICYIYFKESSRKVYMLDFACYKPPPNLMCSKEQSIEVVKRLANNNVSEEMLCFLKNGMYHGGLGDSTYLSEAQLRVPPNPSLESAREEAEMVMFGAIDELLAKTNDFKCKDIRILIVNCSVFNVVPSLSSIIINRYKLREDVLNYNVTGMGCSAGLVAIGLAKQLLKVHVDQYALVVTTENITQNCYVGKEQSKCAANCVFRLGGAAILLSNRSDRKKSKYQLLHTVHVNTASSDLSYNSIFQEEDEAGLPGITIRRDLLVAASSAIESNIATLSPLILLLSEKIKIFINFLVRKFLITGMVPQYAPTLSKCIEHFFPHVGGKPVIDQLQKLLGFSDYIMEAPRMTLYRFGNTSSSSVWYELAYAEAKGRIKKGHRLWQMAYGSGFKCSSLIWRAMRTIDSEEMSPWRDEIAQYPINMDNIGSSEPLPFYLEPIK